MKIWINTHNDDEGITNRVFYSQGASDESAGKFIKALWDDQDGPIPADWREAQDRINDRGGIDHVQVLEVDLDVEQLFPGCTRAHLAEFGLPDRDSTGNPCVWRNEYRCDGDDDVPTHDDEWDDEWSCQCDDECPTCGGSVSPHTSTFAVDVPPALEALWAALPEKT